MTLTLILTGANALTRRRGDPGSGAGATVVTLNRVGGAA
jgi:hypothetical protein